MLKCAIFNINSTSIFLKISLLWILLFKRWETFLININLENFLFWFYKANNLSNSYASSHPNNRKQISEGVKASISGFNSTSFKFLLHCVRNTNHIHILKLCKFCSPLQLLQLTFTGKKKIDIGTELYFCQCLIRMWFSTPLWNSNMVKTNFSKKKKVIEHIFYSFIAASC